MKSEMKTIFITILALTFPLLSLADAFVFEHQSQDSLNPELTYHFTHIQVRSEEEFEQAMKYLKTSQKGEKFDIMTLRTFSQKALQKLEGSKKNTLIDKIEKLSNELSKSPIIKREFNHLEVSDPTKERTPSSRPKAINKIAHLKKLYTDPIYLGEWYNKDGRLTISKVRGTINGAVAFSAGLFSDNPNWLIHILDAGVMGGLGYSLQIHNDLVGDATSSLEGERKLKKKFKEYFPFLNKDSPIPIKQEREVNNKVVQFFKDLPLVSYFYAKWYVLEYSVLALLELPSYALNALGVINVTKDLTSNLTSLAQLGFYSVASQGFWDTSVTKEYGAIINQFNEAIEYFEKSSTKNPRKKYKTEDIFIRFSNDKKNLIGDHKANPKIYDRLKKDLDELGPLTAKQVAQRLETHSGTLKAYRAALIFFGSASWAVGAVAFLANIPGSLIVFGVLGSAGLINEFIRLRILKGKYVPACDYFLDKK